MHSSEQSLVDAALVDAALVVEGSWVHSLFDIPWFLI